MHDLETQANGDHYQSNSAGIIVDIAEATARWLGYARAELIGLPAATLWQSADQCRVFQESVDRVGSAYEGSCTLRMRSGAPCPSRARITPLQSQGEEVRGYEVSIARVAQTALDATPVSHSESRELLGVLRLAGHELREPMRKIAMHTDRLERLVKSDDAAHRLVHQIAQENDRINRVLTEITQHLGFIQRPVEAEAIDLQRVIECLHCDVDAKLGDQGLSVSSNLTETVQMDRHDAWRLFNEIVAVLAYGASAQQPRSLIFQQRESIGEMIEIAVQVDGAIAIAKQIFEPFLRNQEGQIIPSLFISQQIVQRWGGTIHLERDSALNRVLRFTLPRAVNRSQ